MKEKFFPEGDPIGKLYVEQMSHDVLTKRFLNGVELDLSGFHETRQFVVNAFPERYMDTSDRINDAISSLKSMYKHCD